MEDNTLFPIRCPYKRLSRSEGKLYRCNSLCVEVTKGSGGVARCRKCSLNFPFRVDEDAKQTVGVTVKAQAVPADLSDETKKFRMVPVNGRHSST